ncbi:MAG TPA: thioredoxin family protein [Longimicrobium sp.]|nr:thioredoxin family protein [Longimicrobium sp.]
MSELSYPALWEAGYSWGDYLGNQVREHRDLWLAVNERATVPPWALDEAAALGGGWKLLVISEDWCGDASNTVPVIAKWAEAAPGVAMRIVKRDENLELMDAYLTRGARSIPLAVILDREWRPVGRWGPRPAELQEFVLREKKAAERPADEIYRDVRRWYARDRGESTLRELLAAMRGA